jgi:hypothetical protein
MLLRMVKPTKKKWSGFVLRSGFTVGLDEPVEKILDGAAFSVDAAIAYLRALEGDKGLRAREYLTKAPPSIQTMVRVRARKDLRWDDIPLPPMTVEEAPSAQC